MAKDTCLIDMTFEWTKGSNAYLLENLILRDWVVMFNSAWIDITLCGLLFLYKFDKLASVTFALALFFAAFLKSIT